MAWITRWACCYPVGSLRRPGIEAETHLRLREHQPQYGFLDWLHSRQVEYWAQLCTGTFMTWMEGWMDG